MLGEGGRTIAQSVLDAQGMATHLPRTAFFKDRTIDMAKTSPAEFINQVRTEARKIVWPTGRETVQTTIMVLIMTTILSLFFLGVDTVFNAIVSWLTSLAR
jgi:preprotein translocase subunit SecE